MQELKANTQVKVRIGPFVDVTDGFTPETGITLGAADEAELLKHDGVATVDISGNTWAAVTGCRGWFDLTLTAGNVDTEGKLTVVVQDDSECLPVHAHFMVLSQAAWDSKYAAKDSGYMDVNVKAISDDTTAADNAELDYDGTGYAKANSTIGTCTANSDMRGTDSANTTTPPTAAAVASAVWSTVIDVLTASQTLKRLLSLRGGKKTKDDGAGTIVHYAQDGTTPETTETIAGNDRTFA